MIHCQLIYGVIIQEKQLIFVTNKLYQFRSFDIVEFPEAKMMTDEQVAW